MSLTNVTPELIFEIGRSAVYLMALVLGFLMSAKGRRASLLCMLGGLLAVYALLGSRLLCDAMWESVRYDRTVAIARDVTLTVQLIGFGLEVLGLTLVVLAVFTGRKPVAKQPAPTAESKG